jgi:hypothetical protein
MPPMRIGSAWYAEAGRCLRPTLSAHTAQALGAGRYPLQSLTQDQPGMQ